MRKCPPGILCFENFTAFFLIVIILAICYYFYKSTSSIHQNIYVNPSRSNNSLSNPYSPPLVNPLSYIPINQPTNISYVNTNYNQIGILTPLNQTSKDNILPLMGKQLFTGRDKWNYYTISNQHNNVKLPVSRGGKSCTNEYGCDRIFDGDTVYVEGAGDSYKATIYENDILRYMPSL